MYPKNILNLINFFKKLPGVGAKTAERFVFHLIKWPYEESSSFGLEVQEIKENIRYCPECGMLLNHASCFFCDPNRRRAEVICIASSIKDVFNIEKTGSYNGMYHVIDDLVSPLEEKNSSVLRLDILKARIKKLFTKEIILAIDSTVEGDVTSLLIKEGLSCLNLKISRFAFGLPLGSSLEYIDHATLTQALLGRQTY